MNKRGDLAFTLLGLFAIVVAGAALFTFVSFAKNLDVSSYNYSILLNQVYFSKEYVVQEAVLAGSQAIKEGGDTKGAFQKIIEERNYRVKQFGNFTAKVRNGEFEFIPDEDKTALIMNGISVNSERGSSKIQRNFDLRIEFNDKGEVRKIYK